MQDLSQHPFNVKLTQTLGSIEKGDLSSVKLFLEQLHLAAAHELPSQPPNFTSYVGFSLLYQAAAANQAEIVAWLVENPQESSWSIDIPGGPYQSTPLHWACQTGAVGAVSLLLSYGANPMLVDKEGLNAWHMTAYFNQVYILWTLLANCNRNSIVEQVNASDKYGRTPLMMAASHHVSSIMYELLVRYGGDLRKTDQREYSTLHYAIENGDEQAVRVLLKLDTAASNEELKMIGEFAGIQSQAKIKNLVINSRLSPWRYHFQHQFLYGYTLICIVLCWFIVMKNPWIIGYPIAALVFWGYLHLVQYFIVPGVTLIETVLPTAILQISMMLCYISWIVVLVPCKVIREMV
jgi:hypothetical protein